MALLTTSMMGCADKDETKKSSDFATNAIEAKYLVEVSEAHKVVYQANFIHDDNSLELEGGDVITITSVASEKIALEANVSGGKATYRLSRTETSDPTRPFFDFTRTSQTDATGSFVQVPNAFVLNSPTANNPDYVPSDGKQFTLSWTETSSAVPTPDDNEEFTLRYDFSCRNDSGNPSTSKTFIEKVVDNGTHVINLAAILGAGDYDACSQFDIIAIRSNAKSGTLDNELKSGSTVGSQIRTVKGSLDGLQLN